MSEREYQASSDVMPWERPLPTFDEYEGWRICDVCGTTWKATLSGFDFYREWRYHVYLHREDKL